ncbi:hypothetical protein KSP39_PZI009895 [Platanthera zijinensis]|uniref:Uncharacterized protein n=1 Tax=Platanthera zijinensis TaxID=2320716 RepID=A0AAP0BI02_9ASPA
MLRFYVFQKYVLYMQFQEKCSTRKFPIRRITNANKGEISSKGCLPVAARDRRTAITGNTMHRCFVKLAGPLISSSLRLLSRSSSTRLHVHSILLIRSVNTSVTPFIPFCHSRLRPHSSPLFPVFQSRHFAKAKKKRSRAPDTPIVSKVKKYKMKSYSSFKSRFRTLSDGQIRRWRAGKRHNAHLKVWILFSLWFISLSLVNMNYFKMIKNMSSL